MSLPNMKTFCVATMKPYLQSMSDNFNKRLDNIISNEDLLNDVAEKTEQQEATISDLVKVSASNASNINTMKTAIDKATNDLEHIPATRLIEICRNAWTDA